MKSSSRPWCGVIVAGEGRVFLVTAPPEGPIEQMSWPGLPHIGVVDGMLAGCAQWPRGSMLFTLAADKDGDKDIATVLTSLHRAGAGTLVEQCRALSLGAGSLEWTFQEPTQLSVWRRLTLEGLLIRMPTGNRVLVHHSPCRTLDVLQERTHLGGFALTDLEPLLGEHFPQRHVLLQPESANTPLFLASTYRDTGLKMLMAAHGDAWHKRIAKAYFPDAKKVEFIHTGDDHVGLSLFGSWCDRFWPDLWLDGVLALIGKTRY